MPSSRHSHRIATAVSDAEYVKDNRITANKWRRPARNVRRIAEPDKVAASPETGEKVMIFGGKSNYPPRNIRNKLCSNSGSLKSVR